MTATVKGLPTAEQLPAALATPVQGWAYDNDEDAPAVIVNPNASASALQAWAYGQLQQANVLMSALGCAKSEGVVPVQDVVGALRHFNEQALAVLEALGEQLRRDEAPEAAA